MGAFNKVLVKVQCNNCKNLTDMWIQFKYGDCWQYEYKIGDKIRWGGNDKGTPGTRKVVVDSEAEECPICHRNGGRFEVYIENDIIKNVNIWSGQYDKYDASKGYYIIIEK